MKKVLAIILAGALCLMGTGVALAGGDDTITGNYQVTAINEIVIAGESVTVTVNAATAGSAPDQSAADTSSYAITTNCGEGGKKITAVLNSAMSSGLTLKLDATAPSTGTTVPGYQTLTDTAVDVVTAISGVAQSGIALSFTLDATIAAGVVGSANKTVTLTIVDAS